MISRKSGPLFAMAVAGCATPSQGSLPQSPAVPSIAEVERAYRAFVAETPCPEQAICGRPPAAFVSDPRCERRGSARASCRFTTFSQYGGPRYSCHSHFERDGERWLMEALAETCRFVPWPLPSAREIARLETGLRLDNIVQSVGVSDTASMNRAARVRVRSATCRYLPNHEAICSYQARPCPEDGQATSRDGWCSVEARFAHTGESPVSAMVGLEQWAISRLAAETSS